MSNGKQESNGRESNQNTLDICVKLSTKIYNVFVYGIKKIHRLKYSIKDGI